MGKKKDNPQEKWWENDPHADKDALGVVLHRADGQWAVARTLLGSPAEKAGLQPGDVLLAVAANPLSSDLGEAVIEKTLSFLPEGESLEVALLRSKQTITVRTSFEPLRKLLEQDLKQGGAELGYCRTCKKCGMSLIGYFDCKLQGGTCSRKCMIA